MLLEFQKYWTLISYHETLLVGWDCVSGGCMRKLILYLLYQAIFAKWHGDVAKRISTFPCLWLTF